MLPKADFTVSKADSESADFLDFLVSFDNAFTAMSLILSLMAELAAPHF